MLGTYVLVDRVPVHEPDWFKWATGQSEQDRRVALSELPEGFTISTVFLGIDHRFLGDGPPIVFETMVFCDYDSIDWEDCPTFDRYATWEEAERGHARITGRIEGWIKGLTDRKTRPTWMTSKPNRETDEHEHEDVLGGPT